LPDDTTTWLESLDGEDLLGSFYGGYDSYLAYPSFSKMCPFFSFECDPRTLAIEDGAAAFSDGIAVASVVTFGSRDQAQTFIDDNGPSFESSGDWQLDLGGTGTGAVEPDGLSYWIVEREFGSPGEAAEYFQASARLRDYAMYRDARAGLAETARTIFFFDGSQNRRSGSSWMGPIVPATGIGGITWDGTTLRGNTIIKINTERDTDTESTGTG
jgi:hypothetical protein